MPPVRSGSDVSAIESRSDESISGLRDGSPDLDNLIAHAYGYAYRLTGSQTYLNLGTQVFNTAVANGYAGAAKQYNQQFRSSGRFVAYVTQSTPPPTDTTAPTAAVTAPTAGQSVSGTITATATASDNVGVTGVQFLVDGQAYGAEDTSAPYSVSITTTTLTNASHTIAARARDARNNTTTSAAVSFTVNNSGSTSFAPIRVNAGGAAYTDPQGNAWRADTGFSGGNGYSTGRTIAGTTTPQLYQSQRYGTTFQYQFAVPNGSYNVKLKFAEIYFTTAGSRVCNVIINGQTALSRFDIVTAAGAAYTAVDRQFQVPVTGGQIVIQVTSVVSNASINAIEISPAI